MRFSQGMDALNAGKKVTREDWIKTRYFLKEGDNIYCYQKSLKHYIYNENIMLSDGWLIAYENGNFNNMKEYHFCEIIPLLVAGAIAKKKFGRIHTFILILQQKLL